MSLWSEISGAFTTVFTRPSKANFKQFVEVGTLTFGTPFVNSTVEAPFAALSYPFLPAAPAAAPLAAGTIVTAPGLDLAIPGFTTAAGITPTVGGVAGASAADTAAVALTPSVAGLSSPAGGAGFFATLAAGAKGVGGFVKGAAEVSLAARTLAEPWIKTAAQIRDAVAGGVTSRPVPVAAGGGNLANGASSPAVPASSLVPAVVVGGAALAVGYYVVTKLLPRGRHA